jgi:2-C-methyl-D-erythritol 2,4-cyclodiphosphate synthase
MNLVGIGQDSHKFLGEKNVKDLILGGIKIDFGYGLEGNSDADVIIHSLCNAISSAIGGNSLGTWSDEMCLKKGIKDSKEYLKVVIEKMKQFNLQIANVSIAVEAKKPFIKMDDINKMKNILAKALEIEAIRLGITFTSGEELTAFGKGEGIQVFSMVNLISNEN